MKTPPWKPLNNPWKPTCHWCREQPQTLILYGCLNQHYYEQAFCRPCTKGFTEAIMHCAECGHPIAHSLILTLPEGHTPIGRFT